MGGGAVHSNGGTTSFTNCTFSNNTSAATATNPNGAGGGALMNNGGTMTITNCTFYNNTSAMYGGAIHNRYASSTCDINNSILVNNPADSTGDISGNIGSTIGYNIITSTSGATLTGTTTGNLIGLSAIIVIDTILADNGSYRFTHNLISGSPAIDAAISAPGKDQRKFFRNGNPDIGALEYNGINPCSSFTATITQNKVGCFYDLSADVNGGTSNFSTRWYDGTSYYCQDSLNGMGLGTYYFTAIDDSGCVAKDSITISTLNMIVDTSISICFGDSILFKGNYIKTDSILSDTTSIGACDSIYTINLDVLPQITANLSLVSGSYNSINCYGDTAIFVATGGSSYLWDDLSTNDTLVYVYDTTFTVPYNVIVSDTNGCSDSTGITFAGVYPPVRDTSLTYTLCYGDAIVIAGTPYDSTATYMITTPSVTGCDSIITLDLTILDPIVDTSTTLNNLTISSNQNGATYEWIDCSTNTAIVPAETGQSFTATTNGNYAVVITVGYCSDISACVSIMSVGINELNNAQNASIYPNPTNDLFTIKLNKTDETTQIRIIDILGNIVYNNSSLKNNQVEINASTWVKGIYLVNIKSEYNSEIIKLIIQ
jgi:hypothetical protein